MDRAATQDAELARTEVLVVDCQATAARLVSGFVTEIAWARARASGAADDDVEDLRCRLIAPPPGASMSPAVERITGLSVAALAGGARVEDVFRDVLASAREVASRAGVARAPTVAHFARFEHGIFDALHELHGDGLELPIDWVCTHEIARRLLPGLPRRGIRPLTGYFGRAVGPLRRGGDHVRATAFVWRHVVAALASEGVTTWAQLREWLARPAPRPGRREYPMPRALRLSLPDAPGVYRLLRTSGDVIYVGKATSLKKRVSQHFTKQSRLPDRALELLAQVRDVSFVETESALEAALLEADEIKRCRPPYNVALVEDARSVWWSSDALDEQVARVDDAHPVGPFGWESSTMALGAIAQLIERAGGSDSVELRSRALSVPARWGPDEACFQAGFQAFREAHGAALGRSATAITRLRALGARLRRSALATRSRDADVGFALVSETTRAEPRGWDPALVRESLEELVTRDAQAMRRARWMMAMSQSCVSWREPAMRAGTRRVLVIVDGDVVERSFVDAELVTPTPPRFERGWRERAACFDVARLDRLRVLTTELRRLLSERAATRATDAEIRLAPRRVLRGESLRRALDWV